MASFSPLLPITRDSADGFTVIRDFPTMVKQNFKMLLLTIPGERVMDPEYGAGLQTFLFEDFSDGTYSRMDDRIREQAGIYLPYLTIDEVNFVPAQDTSQLGVTIKYSIPRIGAEDLLAFTI